MPQIRQFSVAYIRFEKNTIMWYNIIHNSLKRRRTADVDNECNNQDYIEIF